MNSKEELFVVGETRPSNHVVLRMKNAGEERLAKDIHELRDIPPDAEVVIVVSNHVWAVQARILLKQRKRVGKVTVVVTDSSLVAELAKYMVGEKRRLFTSMEEFEKSFPSLEKKAAA